VSPALSVSLAGMAALSLAVSSAVWAGLSVSLAAFWTV
jgi:hypothetical protein